MTKAWAGHNLAEQGDGGLFDGQATPDALRRWERSADAGWRSRGDALSAREILQPSDLPPDVARGLAGSPSPDTRSLRPGILLVPQTSTYPARAWVRFPTPRRISTEEMIAADLLAQAFGLAVDRSVDRQRAADTQSNLEQAIESHRMIGQAVGILVERHRVMPAQAFDRIRVASQNRNLKLRDLAVRVIQTGAEPEDA